MDAAAAAPAPPVVTVVAADYSYRMPDTVAAGMTTFRLVNRGTEMHHVAIYRLRDGHTMADLLGAMKPEAPAPAWADALGGPNTPAPGDSTEASLELTPGHYAMICVIPAADGVPHVMKGMAHAFTVVRRPGAMAAAPATDGVLALDDYSFTFAPALRAGHHEIRVENRAKQDHEVVIVALAPGKTLNDVLAWSANPAGPPPGRPIGGTTFFKPGAVNYLSLDLPTSEYALLCFVPDARDGQPHVAHGMAQQLSVR